MKNENQFLFQNGMSWIISALLVKNNKGEIHKASPYMYKHTDGLWYPDKQAWYMDTPSYHQYTYGKAINYQIMDASCSFYNGAVPERLKDKVLLLYFESVRVAGAAGTSTFWRYFKNRTLIYFNNIDDAINCLINGDYSKAIEINNVFDVDDNINIGYEVRNYYMYERYTTWVGSTTINDKFYYSSIAYTCNDSWGNYYVTVKPIPR